MRFLCSWKDDLTIDFGWTRFDIKLWFNSKIKWQQCKHAKWGREKESLTENQCFIVFVCECKSILSEKTDFNWQTPTHTFALPFAPLDLNVVPLFHLIFIFLLHQNRHANSLCTGVCMCVGVLDWPNRLLGSFAFVAFLIWKQTAAAASCTGRSVRNRANVNASSLNQQFPAGVCVPLLAVSKCNRSPRFLCSGLLFYCGFIAEATKSGEKTQRLI